MAVGTTNVVFSVVEGCLVDDYGFLTFSAVDALAIIYKDGYMESFLQIAIMLGLAWAGIKAAVTREGSNHMVRWFAGYLFVILVLLHRRIFKITSVFNFFAYSNVSS